MIIEFFKTNWLTISSLIGGASAWYFERNKRKQDAKTAEVQHSQSIIAMYENALNDIPKQFEGRMKALEDDVIRLNGEITEWKNKYSLLKKQFEDYKRKLSKV